MAAIPGSVPVPGFIAPSDSTDAYPSHDSIYGRGGLREVATLADRNAITTDRRREGMLVFVTSSSTYWRLLAGPWTGTDTDWMLFTGGGGGGTYTHIQGVAATVWTVNHPLNGYPNVVVIDSGNNNVEGTIQYVTTSQLTITFEYPISGTAQLN